MVVPPYALDETLMGDIISTRDCMRLHIVMGSKPINWDLFILTKSFTSPFLGTAIRTNMCLILVLFYFRACERTRLERSGWLVWGLEETMDTTR